MSPVNFKCNVNKASVPLPHFWEHTVGSSHATIALRADWQQQLTRCSQRTWIQARTLSWFVVR